MPVQTPSSRRIRILRDEVSRKIAAGEVIDRPFSIVRELLDNALDAGASSVDVFLEAGGLSRVRVVDDGAGMSREDLELCWRPHATSKIENEDDLLTVRSLGFRGEALSSVAVCSRLSIVSAEPGRPAHRLEVVGGKLLGLDASAGRKGTAVDVSELFFNYPARKKFLRSVSAESGLCRAIFLDRAAAHPAIGFRLSVDGQLKASLPPAGQVERLALAYAPQLDSRALGMASVRGPGFTITVAAGDPEMRRRDRKLIQVFVNRRRISEFSLIQAVEHGFSGHVPGGWYPVAFVFVDIDPGLVDFNIHPAKKEARFRNLPDVHGAVVGAVRKLLGGRSGDSAPARASAPGVPRPREETDRTPGSPAADRGLPAAFEAARGPRFLGQVFGVFLAFELPDRLVLLDQHAAHEKLIFERLGERVPVLQEMLFPLSFDVSDEEDRRIAGALEELGSLGIACRRTGFRSYEITALSADFLPLNEESLVELVRGVGGNEWARSLRATAACRLAVKEGDPVDPATAADLCVRARALENPRCPHGRPIWHEIPKDVLFGLVDRPAPKPGPR